MLLCNMLINLMESPIREGGVVYLYNYPTSIMYCRPNPESTMVT